MHYGTSDKAIVKVTVKRAKGLKTVPPDHGYILLPGLLASVRLFSGVTDTYE